MAMLCKMYWPVVSLQLSLLSHRDDRGVKTLPESLEKILSLPNDGDYLCGLSSFRE